MRCRFRKTLCTDFPDDAGFSSQDQPLLCGGEDGEGTLEKGCSALGPPCCSLHTLEAQWCPTGSSRSIRTTTAAGHFGHKRRTTHPLYRSNTVAAYFSCTGGHQLNLQLEIIQHTQRIAEALRGLLVLEAPRLMPSVSGSAGRPPGLGPIAFAGGRMGRAWQLRGRGHHTKVEEDSGRGKSGRLRWIDQHCDKGTPFHRLVGPPGGRVAAWRAWSPQGSMPIPEVQLWV